jgi:hypothetical protein
MKRPEPNEPPGANSRPVSRGRSGRFGVAAVAQAECYRDMKLHSILLGWSNPDQALRVAAGILGERASGGRPGSDSGLLPGVRSLPDNASNLEASIRGRVRMGGHG